MFAEILGGIGFFLLGMTLMTDGLKTVAGDSLRHALQRFTKGPITGTITGAIVTAIVQSSSATTLATIGFVSAGLLPFVNAIGLIFGANIGTTTTGWMVSLLGLKFSISSFALPLIGVGALIHLFGRGRVQPAGFVLAGFGMIFVAISTLQAGMGELSQHIDPTTFAMDGLSGRLLLVLVGIVMTIILQSSTVALVTTMAAVHTGTIDLTHAAALVVGQNVGTTFTAVLAAVGAGVPAQRTALAHVLFNVITALLAFLILPYFVSWIDMATERAGITDDSVSLAAFHTAFSVLGILMILPFSKQFAALIERIIPERTSRSLTAGLDMSAAAIPAVALAAVQNALRETALRLVTDVERRCANDDPVSTAETEASVQQVRAFLANIATKPSDKVLHKRHVALLHVADHLDDLNAHLRKSLQPLNPKERETLAPVLDLTGQLVAAFRTWEQEQTPDAAQAISDISSTTADLRRSMRRKTLSRSAKGQMTPEAADALIDHVAWLDSSGYHVARAAHYLQEPERGEEELPPAPTETAS